MIFNFRKKRERKIESLKSYFTKQGWKRDYQRTKEDFKIVYNNSKELSDIVRKNSGNALVTGLGLFVITPMCAVAGSYFGEVVGELAELASGMTSDFNLFRSIGLVVGLVWGLHLGYKLTTYLMED